jgi:hypothetical protein
MSYKRLCGGDGRIYSHEIVEMAAAVAAAGPILKDLVTNIGNHPKLHEIITYYDMKKDAAATVPVTETGRNTILNPALDELIPDRNRITITQYSDFFEALEAAMKDTIYTKVKKIGRLQKDEWENDNINHILPSFIKYAIEESFFKPKDFNNNIQVYLSIASYLDPYNGREKTRKAFSYDFNNDINERVSLGAGETFINGKEIESIGIIGVKEIEGRINGGDWSCDTKITFNSPIKPRSVINRFNEKFVETGTSSKEFFLGNATKNKFINILRAAGNRRDAIDKTKVYLLCKEIGDALQVYLGNKLADQLPEPETSPLGIFSCDKVVGMRTRLTKKMNAIIKNHGDTPLGAYYDECNLYLCRDNPRTELLSIAEMNFKNYVNYNNTIKQKYINAYNNGFSIPSSRDIGRNHEKILEFFRNIVRDINIKNALAFNRYQYLVGYIEEIYPAGESTIEIGDILRVLNDSTKEALDAAKKLKNKGREDAASRDTAVADPSLRNFTLCMGKITEVQQRFTRMKATDAFKYNAKQEKYKLDQNLKSIFTDETPFADAVIPLGNIVLNLVGTNVFDNYTRMPWEDPTNYLESYNKALGAHMNPGKRKREQGGGGENWEELSGIETSDMDLLKMTNNPNKFLKEKVYEYYGANDEMYMFGLMNSIYHYLDYVNEITVDRDILDIIKTSYDTSQSLPLDILDFTDFESEYYRIKQKKINQYYEKESERTTLNSQGNLLAANLASNVEQQKKLNAFYKEADSVHIKFGEFARNNPKEAASMLLSAAGTPTRINIGVENSKKFEKGTDPRTIVDQPVDPIVAPAIPRVKSYSLETQGNASPELAALAGNSVSPMVYTSPGLDDISTSSQDISDNPRFFTPIQVNKTRSRRRPFQSPFPNRYIRGSTSPATGGSRKRKYRKTRKTRKNYE